MRALLLRRTAFVAILATGLGLTASAVHGLSDMDSSLQLAAVSTKERPALVSDRDRDDCPDARPDGRRLT